MFNLLYPREVCSPRRTVVMNKEDFLKFINSNKNHCNLYTNVYNYADFKINGFNQIKPEYNTAIIDRIYFDADKEIGDEPQPEDGYYALMKIHKWCEKHNYINYPILTGNGYNNYIATKPNIILRNKRKTVFNAQTFILKELKIKTDPRVFGQIERISRIPFTYNFSANRYVIPLPPSIINLGNEKIKKIAGDVNKVKLLKKESAIYGSKYWDVSKFDTLNTPYVKNIKVEYTLNKDIEANVKGDIPDCIKHLLSIKKLGWDGRKDLILWLRDSGYLLEECLSILQKHLSPKKFKHCISPQDGKQPYYLYRRDDLMFPLQENLIMRGICPHKNKCELAKNACLMYNRENEK